MNETNIATSSIEKGLDIAKELLSKLISPSIEEIGLLVADNIKLFRFKNQVKILNKAQKYISDKGISIKQIPVKILVPLLENASLEEEEELQEKWSNMICNMADSETNLTNHVFPYILGQISKEEFYGLEKLNIRENEHWTDWEKLRKIEESGGLLSFAERKIKDKLKNNNEEGFYAGLDDYELENLIRLGLIRKLPPKITIEEFKTGGWDNDSKEEYHNLKAEYDTYSSYHRITELGSQFVKICSLNKN